MTIKPYVDDFEDDLSQDKLNDISLGNDNEEFLDDDLNNDEEPTEDVDGEDENIDKAALEKAAEEKMESLERAYVFYLSCLKLTLSPHTRNVSVSPFDTSCVNMKV